MLDVDYSIKQLTVFIAKHHSKGNRVNCIIFNENKMKNNDHETAQYLHNQFIQDNEHYDQVRILTEMGPGEFITNSIKELNPKHPIWIGGHIAPFSISPGKKRAKKNPFRTRKNIEEFWKNNLWTHIPIKNKQNWPPCTQVGLFYYKENSWAIWRKASCISCNVTVSLSRLLRTSMGIVDHCGT